jgi:hypothetical protein
MVNFYIHCQIYILVLLKTNLTKYVIKMNVKARVKAKHLAVKLQV